jgi:hypothetical protein
MTTTTIPDLWPTSFGDAGPPTPVAILRQQGVLLGQKTGNLVYGEVHSRATGLGEFAHTFEVTAPLLGYRHPILVVTHKVSPYPAQLSAPPATVGPNQFQISTKTTAASASEFMERLREWFQSEGTIKLLQSLIAQSTDLSPEHV